MNISPWLIYLWGIADGIGNSLEACAVVTGVIAVFVCVAYGITAGEDGAEEAAPILPWLKRAVALFVFFFFTQALMPSSKTIAIMVVAPAIVNSEPIQKDLPEIYNLAKDALKEALKPE